MIYLWLKYPLLYQVVPLFDVKDLLCGILYVSFVGILQ
jgi:hypothetical protein